MDKQKIAQTLKYNYDQWDKVKHNFEGQPAPQPEFEFLKYIQISKGDIIAYRQTGVHSKFVPVIVAIHGLLCSSLHFDKIAEELKGSWQFIAYDQRNFGHSKFSQKQEIVSMDDYVNDLKNFLDQLKITKCVLIGHSFGAAVAMTFTGLYPERVRKLVLIGSISLKGFPLYKLNEKGLQTNIVVSSYKELLNERLPIDLSDDKMLQIYFEETWFNQGRVPLDFKKYIQESQLQKGFIEIAWICHCFNISDDPNYIAKGNSLYRNISCPVFLIYGENDLVVKQSTKLEMEQWLSAEMILIAKTGHLPFLQEPEFTAQLINEFLIK